MGGGLLVAYAGTLSDDKEEIRRTIALGYLAFALTQLFTLIINQPQFFRAEYFYLPIISLAAYLGGKPIILSLKVQPSSAI